MDSRWLSDMIDGGLCDEGESASQVEHELCDFNEVFILFNDLFMTEIIVKVNFSCFSYENSEYFSPFSHTTNDDDSVKNWQTTTTSRLPTQKFMTKRQQRWQR